MSDEILLGYIVRSFGLKGGVVIKLINEFSSSLIVGKKITLRRNKFPDVVMTIASIMQGGRIFFEEITDKTLSDTLKGSELFIHRADLPPLLEDEFYLVDLLGALVVDTNGQELGEIIGFSDNTAQILFEVKTLQGHVVSIPSIKPIVQKIDCENRYVIIAPPEGLLEPLD